MEKSNSNPEDHQIHAECKAQFDFNEKEHGHFWQHLKDSEPVRTDVIKLKEQIVTVFNNLDGLKRIPSDVLNWVIIGSGLNLVVIIVAALIIGRYLERIDNLKESQGKRAQAVTVKGAAYAAER